MSKLKRMMLYGNRNISNHNIVIKKNFKTFRRSKLLFIHIPKAAGISFYQGLFAKESLGHIPLTDYIDEYGSDAIANLFTCTIVRNPYDRLYSAYSYLKKGGRGRENDLVYQSIINQYSSFEYFVLDIFKTKAYLQIEHLVPQTNWLCDEVGEIKLDYIGRFENLDIDFLNIIQKSGHNPEEYKLKKMNVTREKNTPNYTQKMINVVNEVYTDDFKNFGYQKM